MPDETFVERPRLLQLVRLQAADEVRRLQAQRVQQRAQRDLELSAGGGRSAPAGAPRVSLGKKHLRGRIKSNYTNHKKEGQITELTFQITFS